MNFISIMSVALVTFFVTSPFVFLMAALIFAVGIRNNEEAAYNKGFMDGLAAKRNRDDNSENN